MAILFLSATPFPRLPYIRKILIALYEKGLFDQLEIICGAADPYIPLTEFMRFNLLDDRSTLESENEVSLCFLLENLN